MSLAAALAAASHHSAQQYAAPRGQTTGTKAREGEVREQYYGLRAQERPLPGMRPAPLLEVLPQVGLQRHTVEQRIVHTPYVQILDALVPQKVEQLVDFFKDLDIEVPAQVIEVPKISQDIIPQRSVDLVPQMAEQLVEVPTLLSVAVLQQRTAEQLASIPVPRGRVQGFLPVQSSTAISSSGKRISERTVEQILGQGSSSSAGPADEDFIRVFLHFSPWEKSARAAASPSAELPREVSSWTPAAYRARHRRFAGRLFILPESRGCGFIESSAEAEFGGAAFGGFRVPVSWEGHFAADAFVTFSVRTGPDGCGG